MTRPLSSKYSVELGFSFPKRIGSNLEPLRYAVLNQNSDLIIIIDGDEGTGKSMVASQIAYFLDIDSYEETGEFHPETGKPIYEPTGRNIDIEKQVVFNFQDFKEAVTKLPPYKAIIFDEAGEATDRRNSSSKINIEFNQFLRECREPNYKFIILVFQSFYDMDMNPAVRRAKGLIHLRATYSEEERFKRVPMRRGFARYYGNDGKKDLYLNDFHRKGFLYPYIPNKSVDVTFSYHWAFNHKAYLEKKIRDKKKQIKNTKRSCPECGGKSLRFSHTKQLFFCRVCPWSGNTTEAENLKPQQRGGKKGEFKG